MLMFGGQRGVTPLMAAAKRGFAACTKLLLEKKVDLEARNTVTLAGIP